MLVEVPRVWYKLVAAGNHKPITNAVYLPLPDWRRIKELKDAGKARHRDKLLKDIDAQDLNVYTGSSQESLGVASKIGPLGGFSSLPLLVEVPTLWYRLVNRKRETLTGVAAVFLSDMNNIEDFLLESDVAAVLCA
ncbi:hypothetical protein V7S43_008607 [Phytophthora oleae]|uniref:Uncharacterized protein n=1 Tax=Phytophthora oleae TaxID=2107226 RepID=A0ABD3FL91_9STRA